MPAKTKKPTRAPRSVKSSSKKKATTLSSKTGLFSGRRFWVIAAVLALFGAIVLYRANAATTSPGGQATWQRFPGDPNPRVTGKAYWGAAISGNGDPVRHESPTGKSLSVRRTYWRWDQKTTSMLTTVKNDIAANRLPVVSIKPPGSNVAEWKVIASGKYDNEIDDMFRKLDAAGGPVWFIIHHEPENDNGNPAYWRAMQVKMRQRMKAVGTKNVAFAANVMSWTFDPASRRNGNDWWVDNTWDIYLADPYCDSSKCNNGGLSLTDTNSWKKYEEFVMSKNIPYGAAEWGDRGTDVNAGKDIQKTWDYGFNNKRDIVAWMYFDSDLNSPSGGWTLKGEPLNVFQSILKNDNRVMRIKDIASTTPTTPTDPTDTGGGGTNTGELAIGIITPSAGATVSSVTKVNAGPDTNVESVSFRLDGVWQTTDDSAPFSWDWNTVTAANGEHTVTIRARKVGDPGNVYTEKSIKVTVRNSTTTPTSPSDSQPPSIPANVTAGLRFDWSKTRYVVDLTWSPSTDDIGVSQYQVVRDFTILGNTKTTNFTDGTNLEAGKTYRYSVSAVDGSGKISTPGSVSIKTSCFLIWCSAEVVQ